MPRTREPRTAPSAARPDVRYDPWIEHLAWLMDSSIGVGRWSVGVDALIGLVPGLGDLAGMLISLSIVARAVRAGVPRVAVARMVANIAIDAALGAVPLAGDLFDAAFKANLKNVQIYRQSLAGGRRANTRHWGFFAALALPLLALLCAVIVLVTMALRSR